MEFYHLYVPLLDEVTVLKEVWEWLPVLLLWDMIHSLHMRGRLPCLIGDTLPSDYWLEFLKQTDTSAHPIHTRIDRPCAFPNHFHVAVLRFPSRQAGPPRTTYTLGHPLL